MKPVSPTPYPDVNEILSLLFSRAQEVLGDQLLGMYLHGSLANGGFDQASDIDEFYPWYTARHNRPSPRIPAPDARFFLVHASRLQAN
jgi:predicted nucleotidyltransferase